MVEREATAERRRRDGRRALLVYMDAALIKKLKKAALDEDCNAYEIVEQATKEWLGRKKSE
ncbi:hypothetical protein IC608_11250 [Devosia sp. PTR5]|uniref:Ribbon-helix-helix protein CopG domain-containing protein n=1 Tax=Devosia oryzisoli TaxID=2774138 RepID=A0A927IT06_9HYPH|nr:hypothetical protein [Devosia oryzisoli]MBD8066049.1 hypothetical protein [Devosia oryzisoli]